MASRLGQYNAALTLIGERVLAAIDEPREPRRVLDDAWDNSVEDCLGQGQWNFATRSVMLEQSSSIQTEFGGPNVYQKPDDWVRTVGFSSSDHPGAPLLPYTDEGGVWITSVSPVYVRYVSKDPEYGLSLGDWPAAFAKYHAAQLALDVAPRLRPGVDLLQILGDQVKRRLFDAQNVDAADEGSRILPLGRLARARGGSYGPYYGRFGQRYS